MDKRDAEAVVLEMRRNKQDHVVVNEGARVTHAKGQLLDQRRPRIGRGIVDLDGARIAQLLCPVLTDRAADEVELSTDREELTREARFAGASDLLELLRGKIEDVTIVDKLKALAHSPNEVVLPACRPACERAALPRELRLNLFELSIEPIGAKDGPDVIEGAFLARRIVVEAAKNVESPLMLGETELSTACLKAQRR